MIRTYSQLHRTDKYSEHSSIVWPNSWVFVYELSRSGSKSSCSHLNFTLRTCFEQGVLSHFGNYRVWIHSETYLWHDKTIQSIAWYRKVLKTHLIHLVCLAKCLSVRLQTKWLWVRVKLQLLKLYITRLLRPKSSLTFRQLQTAESLWKAYVTW